MFDPLSLVAGAALLAAGYLSGRITRPVRATVAVCSCGHGLDQHDPTSRSCHSEVRLDPHFSYEVNAWVGHTYAWCTCRQYIGPMPVEQLIQTQILPPQ